MRPVAVVGSLSLDVIAGSPPRVGGGAYHCARALRLLARPARIVTRCASADRARLLPALVALGVPVEWRGGSSTASFAFSYDGDVRTMTVTALGDPWTREDAESWVEPALDGAAWVHLGALSRADFAVEAVAALARGRRLSLDGQALVRAPRTGLLALDGDFDTSILAHVSVLKLAEEEAEALGGIGGLDVPELVVTRGARGSVVRADGVETNVPAYPFPGDPTGSGDAFAAAYVVSRSAGLPPAAAARRATAVVAELLARRRR